MAFPYRKKLPRLEQAGISFSYCVYFRLTPETSSFSSLVRDKTEVVKYTRTADETDFFLLFMCLLNEFFRMLLGILCCCVCCCSYPLTHSTVFDFHSGFLRTEHTYIMMGMKQKLIVHISNPFRNVFSGGANVPLVWGVLVWREGPRRSEVFYLRRRH